MVHGPGTSSTPGRLCTLTGVATVAEHPDHLAVLGQHLGDQHLDAELLGALGKLTEQHGAQPFALHGVGNLQRDLSSLRPVRRTFQASMATIRPSRSVVATSP